MKSEKVLRQVAKLSFLLGILMSVSGCFAAPVTSTKTNFMPKDLVGQYEGNFPFGRSSLILLKGGTFKQSLFVNDGKSYTSSGGWQLSKDPNGEQRLELDNLMSNSKGNASSGWFSYPLETEDGRASIVINIDDSLAYKQLAR